MEKRKSIKDTVHGYIEIDETYWQIIDTPEFQRLKWIEQTSYRVLYPSARHDRFIHSLGAFHLGKIAFDALITDGNSLIYEAQVDAFGKSSIAERSKELREVFLGACLLHDIGHAPFSHTMERLFAYGPDSSLKKPESGLNERFLKAVKNASIPDHAKESLRRDYLRILQNHSRDANLSIPKEHEITSAIIILERAEALHLSTPMKDNIDLMVRAIIGCTYRITDSADRKTKMEPSLKNCIIRLLNSSSVDVDKLDYITRDTYMSGHDNATIDYVRLLKSSTAIVDEHGQFVPAFRKSALSVITNVVNAKNAQAKWIVAHPVVVYEAYLMKKALGVTIQKFIERYCIQHDDLENECPSVTCASAEASGLCNKHRCNIRNADHFIKRLFSIEALGTTGITIQGRTFRLLSDIDIMSAIKEFFPESDIIQELFDRNKRHKPIWKSLEEYIYLFNKKDRDWRPEIYARFGPFVKMADADDITDRIIVDELFDGQSLPEKSSETHKFLLQLSGSAKIEGFVFLPIKNTFSTDIDAERTYFAFEENANGYTNYARILENTEKSVSKIESELDLSSSPFFYIYCPCDCDKSTFLNELYEFADIVLPST